MGSSSCGRCRDCCDRHPILSRIPLVGKAFRNDASGTGKKISKTESYDAETAMLEETIKIQEALTNFRTSCETKSDELEAAILKKSRGAVDDLIDMLKEINNKVFEGQKLNINIQRLERDNRKTEDIIRGYIKKHIQKRVSLDDDDCLKILKMESGKEKEKEMTEFLNSVLKKAISELNEKVKDSVTEQMKNVEDYIEDRIDSVMISVTEKSDAFDEIKKIKESDEGELENTIIKLVYKHGLCGVAKQILE